ncbi:hypothetical protein [Rhizobium sp. LEGMi135b]
MSFPLASFGKPRRKNTRYSAASAGSPA